MAREKTRSLQQLFTNTLNDLAGLQTAARPAASPLTQISSQPSAGPIRPIHQISSSQPSVSPLETQLPTVHASVRATQPTQPPTMKTSISPAQPSIDQSGAVDFSFKRILSPTSQVQPTHLSARPGQMSTHSASKPGQLTGIYIPPTQFNPQMIHAPQQQLYQLSIHQAHPIQQSLPQSVPKPEASQSLRLSLSPKLTPHQPAHQSPSPISQHRPLGESLSSLPLRKMDWTSLPQGKGPTESQAQYAGGLGSKALLVEQWHHQKPDAVKVRLLDFCLFQSGSHFKSKLMSSLSSTFLTGSGPESYTRLPNLSAFGWISNHFQPWKVHRYWSSAKVCMHEN